MKYIDTIFKLASKFEYKLNKYAQGNVLAEVDTTDVTLNVRPTVNGIISSVNLGELLQKSIQKAANKATESNQEIHGDLKINTYITNAFQQGGKWKIDPSSSGLAVSGTLLNDQIVGPMIKQLLSKINVTIAQALEKEFNRVSVNWKGNKITSHETGVNEINLDL